MRASLVRRLLVALISLHSVVVGAVMLVAPQRMLRTFGWADTCPTFFVEQSGIFMVVLGGAYAVGLWRRRWAWLIVASKGAAVVFLTSEYLLRSMPELLLPVAALDGLMGAAMAATLLWENRSRRGQDQRVP